MSSLELSKPESSLEYPRVVVVGRTIILLLRHIGGRNWSGGITASYRTGVDVGQRRGARPGAVAEHAADALEQQRAARDAGRRRQRRAQEAAADWRLRRLPPR